MWIPFDQLPDTARVWVYQADRPLTDAEVSALQGDLQPAVENWAAHGTPLLGSATVLHNRFLVVSNDESHHQPSGCSIDASVRWVRELGLALKVDFFDRSVAYLTDNNELKTVAPTQIKIAVLSGMITPDTPIFNSQVATKADLAARWQVRAGDSWLKRYFNNVTV